MSCALNERESSNVPQQDPEEIRNAGYLCCSSCFCLHVMGFWGRTVRGARAVRQVGSFPPRVATSPMVLNSAPPMLF